MLLLSRVVPRIMATALPKSRCTHFESSFVSKSTPSRRMLLQCTQGPLGRSVTSLRIMQNHAISRAVWSIQVWKKKIFASPVLLLLVRRTRTPTVSHSDLHHTNDTMSQPEAFCKSSCVHFCFLHRVTSTYSSL